MLAQGDDGRGVACYFVGRGGDGAEESGVAFGAQSGDGVGRQRVPGFAEGGEACGEGGEGEGEGEGGGEGFEDAAAGLYWGTEESMGVWGGMWSGEGCTGMTSRPMPSPGRRPIRRARVAIELDGGEG